MAGLLLVWVAACTNGGQSAGAAPRNETVAVVIKGLDNPFFATMRDGVMASARGQNVRLSFAAAGGLEDTAGQASEVEAFVSQRAGCYVVNPINRTNLVEPLSHLRKGTPVVNIDSPVDPGAAKAVGIKIVSYVGTDNVQAGRVAADAMSRFLGRGARVAVISGIPGDASSDARTSGFSQGAEGRFEIVSTIPVDFDRGRAKLAADQLLRATPPVQGFFAVNDQMALGIADAMAAIGKTGSVPVIGLDGTAEALTAVSSGALAATVAQYPYTIGQLGVQACLASIRKKSVPAKVVAPVQVVTKDNVARAQANFPQPVEPFDGPLAKLLKP
jgi:ABC-type sugar transport system substrate-binding protein